MEEEKLEDLPWEVHFLAKTPRGMGHASLVWDP